MRWLSNGFLNCSPFGKRALFSQIIIANNAYMSVGFAFTIQIFKWKG